MKSISKYIGVSIYFALLLAYTVFDYLNSGNAGYDDSNRRGVYFFLIIIVVYSGIYLFLRHPKSFLVQQFSRRMLFLTIWIFLCNCFTGRLGWVAYVHLFIAVWWIVAYYYFFTYCTKNPNAIFYIIGFFALMSLMFIYFAYSSQSRIQVLRETDHAVINYAYNILAFIPILLLLRKQWVKIFLLILAITALLLSYKRGPLIILPIMYIAYQYGKPNSRNGFAKKLLRIVFVLGLLLAAFFYVDYLSGGFLSSRFSNRELQSGSTRDELWRTALDDIRARDFLSLLIGKGSGSSIDLLTSGVHNEWLEFLFSFGIIGVFLYFLFGVSLIRKFIKMKKNNSEYAPVLGMLVAFFWVVGLFSGFYFVHSSFYFFATMGVIDALDKRALQ